PTAVKPAAASFTAAARPSGPPAPATIATRSLIDRLRSSQWSHSFSVAVVRDAPASRSRGRQERRLVGAVGDPVQVPFDAADVVALLVERGAERRARDRCVVRKSGCIA